MIDTLLDIVFAGILLLAVAGMGQFLLGRMGCSFANRIEEVSFAIAVGLGGLSLIVLLLGLVHLLYVWVVYGLVGAWMLIGIRGMSRLRSALKQALLGLVPSPRSLHFWLLVPTAAGMGLTLVRALAPPYGATDPLAYQLALPKIFLEKHYLSFERTVTGALYPTNMGMLYLVGMALRDGALAQVLHWLTGVLCVFAVWGFGERYFNRPVGIWGAVVFSFVPIVVVFAPQGYIDVGLCYFQFMAFWALFNWCEKPESRALLMAGVLTGLAIGVKHQGMATLLLGVGIVFARSLHLRSGAGDAFRRAAAYSGLALLLVAPWYIRSYVYAGNPVWPLANGFFHGLPFHHAPSVLAGAGASGKGGRMLSSLLPSLEWLRLYWRSMSPWEWTFRPFGAQKDIGVYFAALLPGLLLYARRKRELLLAGFCLVYYLVLIRVLHMNPRYGLVLFAFLSVLCGYVAHRLYSSRCRWIPPLFGAGFIGSLLLNLLLNYQLARPVFPVVLGRETRDFFLRKREGNYRAFQYINHNLPDDSRVMFQGIVRGYYCERPYLWGDHPHSGLIDYRKFGTPEQLLERYRELGVTHILRMIRLPAIRKTMYPDYFRDPFQEAFRKRYLKPLYWDESYIVFEIDYG